MVDKSSHFLICKGGVYYFTRHVPNDLRRPYEKPRNILCLKTGSKNAAIYASKSLASKLDDFWLKISNPKLEVPASHLLIKSQHKETFTSYAPKLSDALKKYFRLKGSGHGEQFFTDAKRNIADVIEQLGNSPLDFFSNANAASFRGWLIKI